MRCLVGGARNFQTARNSCPALLAQHRRHLQRARCRGSTLQIIDRHHHHCASKQPPPNSQCTLGQMVAVRFQWKKITAGSLDAKKMSTLANGDGHYTNTVLQVLCDMSTTLYPLQCLMIPIQTFLSKGCKRTWVTPIIIKGMISKWTTFTVKSISSNS